MRAKSCNFTTDGSSNYWLGEAQTWPRHTFIHNLVPAVGLIDLGLRNSTQDKYVVEPKVTMIGPID